MRNLTALLAVPALAIFALAGSALLPHAERAEAASSCSVSGTWRETRREGGECCMPEHYHSGSGSGSSKTAALADAAADWAGLVDLEYGSAFSHFSRAHGKSVSCSNSGGWSCSVQARPCRLG